VSLKQRTISGLSWNFTGNFVDKAIAFVIGIILARLLTPREYGLVGMVSIFIILTQPFVNSGFSQALIRKKKCTQTDFSTIFYFNFFAGVLLYAILFCVAPYISNFFDEPQLTTITRAIGLIIILEAASLIQITILTREVNFKIQTKIKIIASLVSGIVGIFLAYKGYGVWSLVFKKIVSSTLTSSMLWINNKWKPQLVFSFSVIKELFGFSSKLLISGIIDKVYYNIYNLVIAKYFSAKELGLYTRAQNFKDLGAQQISEIISTVAFPVLSSIQDEPNRLKDNYIKIMTATMFVVFSLMFVLCAVSESLVLTLIGEKWAESIIYLQLLSLVGIYYPMYTLTRSLLYVFGKSGLNLKLQILTKTLAIPTILVGINFGIEYMIIAMIITGLLDFFVKAYYSGKLIGYSIINLLKDLTPSFFLSISVGACLFVIQALLKTSPIITLLAQGFTGAVLLIGLSELFRIREYLFIKEIISDRLSKIKKK